MYLERRGRTLEAILDVVNILDLAVFYRSSPLSKLQIAKVR